MNSQTGFWPSTRQSLLKRMENAEDDDAWQAFQQRYQQPIIAVARKAGLSEEEAQEVQNRSLEAVWRSLSTFDHNRGIKFHSWLAGIVHNRIHERIRDRPKHEPLPDGEPGSSALNSVPAGAITEPEVVHLLEEADERHLDERAWEELKAEVPLKHWQVLHELLVHERTGEEVAARLGVSRTNVYVIRLRMAIKLRQIRARLAAEEW